MTSTKKVIKIEDAIKEFKKDMDQIKRRDEDFFKKEMADLDDVIDEEVTEDE